MHRLDPEFRHPDPHADLYGMFHQLKWVEISLAGGGDTVSRKERGVSVYTQNVREFKMDAQTS